MYIRIIHALCMHYALLYSTVLYSDNAGILEILLSSRLAIGLCSVHTIDATIDA